MIADDAVGKHGEGMGIISVKLARSFYANAAATVGVIHKNKFAPIGMGLLDRGKLPWFGAEDFRSWLFVLCPLFSADGRCVKEQTKCQQPRLKHKRPTRKQERGARNKEPSQRAATNDVPRTKHEELFHTSSTVLLSPNVSVSTPMRWAIRSSKLLMWASEFAGRLQRR
jgi:hypothetical protein